MRLVSVVGLYFVSLLDSIFIFFIVLISCLNLFLNHIFQMIFD